MTKEQEPKSGAEGLPELPAAESVAEFCREMLDLLQMELEVEAVQGEDRIVSVNMSGKDRPYLLSNTAALLNSMEYLANRAFRSGRDAEISSISLDSDNYREHREAELVLLAEMASKKVLSQGKPLTLQPMTPRERRIVHLALASVQGVRSQSAGEGDDRSITIHPA